MVRLSLLAFEDACRQMRAHSGIHRMRIMVKTRPCNKLITLKATDDKVALTTTIRVLADLKILERLLGEFVGASMATAPALPPEKEAKKSKKAKKTVEATQSQQQQQQQPAAGKKKGKK